MAVLRAAARQEALALRHLPPGVRCQPLDIGAAIDDHNYLERRARQNEARRRRKERAA